MIGQPQSPTASSKHQRGGAHFSKRIACDWHYAFKLICGSWRNRHYSAISVMKRWGSHGFHLLAAFDYLFKRGCLVLLPALLLLSLAQAQDARISDNEVNAIAEKMYCPVCENIPLDECHTSACLEWKEEIRQQLAEGIGEQQVINSFVRRFGDQVVGIPQDPLLRALTVLVPVLAVVMAIALGIVTFKRFGRHEHLRINDEGVPAAESNDEAYRQRLEDDLQARR